MARATYTEIECKAALNRVTGMPFSWSLNPYRGCVHACHYCYARATHAYYGLDAGHDFESKIFVKTNLVEVLRKELARSSWAREQVAIGTATDAYQPAEGRYLLTRRALLALHAVHNPVGIVTKSTLILRDLDILSDLAKVARVRVYLTITTVDRELWRSIEPGTPPPVQRLKALARLKAAGIETGVLMAPVLPGITDSWESIDAVATAARAHGATIFHASPLRLAPLVREHYFGWVEQHTPELLARYERAYLGVNAPEAYQTAIEERVATIREAHGFVDEPRRLPASPPARPVLELRPAGPQQLCLAI